jgi:uncharacterized protein with HEPN domain
VSRDSLLYLEDMLEAVRRALPLHERNEPNRLLRGSEDSRRGRGQSRSSGRGHKHVAEEIRLRHPDVAWKRVSGMRDEDILWDVVANKVPEMLPRLEAVLASTQHRNSAEDS